MENFPCGGIQEVVEAGWAGPWRALCKGAPRFIHLRGSQSLHVEHSVAIPTTQQPHNSQHFDSPLMPREDLLYPALRNVCPPSGSTSRRQPPSLLSSPGKQKTWRRSCHSCTSQISDSSGGSFLSCRRRANTCSEWTLLSVRRLTSFISILGNISRS